MIDAEKANYTISRMCRLLNIDRRRYYEWAKRRAVSAATKNCPVTATKVPAGGHENCPVAVMGSARM